MRSRGLTIVTIAAISIFCLGAKGNGCSAEYQPGDGRSATWDVGEIPETAGPDRPMTCEWLESDNCWKQLAKAAMSCMPKSPGTFDEARSVCRFPDGDELELAGSISTPAEGSTQFTAVEHRVLNADGSTCLTGKILGLGHSALHAGDRTVVLQAKSLTAYRVICPDGSSYANDVEGACPDFGARWLDKRVPGYVLYCKGDSDQCSLEFRGAGSGQESRAVTALTCMD